MYVSGKWIISGVLAVAIAGAGASWWFRYSATNQTAGFWGPAVVRLMRDAPTVELYRWDQLPASALENGSDPKLLQTAGGRDLSDERGLVHLRNALLEDRSYRWPAEDSASKDWQWVLVFRDGRRDESAVLLFTADWGYVGTPKKGKALSSEPIAGGLRSFFAEPASQLSQPDR